VEPRGNRFRPAPRRFPPQAFGNCSSSCPSLRRATQAIYSFEFKISILHCLRKSDLELGGLPSQRVLFARALRAPTLRAGVAGHGDASFEAVSVGAVGGAGGRDWARPARVPFAEGATATLVPLRFARDPKQISCPESDRDASACASLCRVRRRCRGINGRNFAECVWHVTCCIHGEVR
jgi:hypothetical protein